MIKELCHDEAILSQRCEVATVEDESVAQDLIDTIKSLDDAGCLAANQIGVTKKVCVYLDDAGEPHVLYNPRLVFGLGASKMEESCLTHEGSPSPRAISSARLPLTRSSMARCASASRTLWASRRRWSSI